MGAARFGGRGRATMTHRRIGELDPAWYYHIMHGRLAWGYCKVAGLRRCGVWDVRDLGFGDLGIENGICAGRGGKGC